MPFSPEQISELSAPLSRAAVKTRAQAGNNVSYVEAWHVIAEANRIFGFDGWSSHTLDVRNVSTHERTIGRGEYVKPGWGVTYTAMVRITVTVNDGAISREGLGAGHGIDVDLGQAHESAIKEAESDARKRALMTFGNQFGLALYDKTQTNVADKADEADEADISRARFIKECEASIARIGDHPDPKDLLLWWNSETERRKRRDFGLLPAEVLCLKELVTAKVKRPA